MTTGVRVRFAPSPTGFMHLGNVRAALMNYIFAAQKKGVFILRIEDTDEQRNIENGVEKIISDLAWLGLNYQEGPTIGGFYGPYKQSERKAFYKKHLDQLIAEKKCYRCFCTVEDLEKKRQKQIALKKPPRYDRACASLTDAQINEHLATQKTFVWRFKLTDADIISVHDLALGTTNFDMSHFADFTLTREDGSFTFLFANCIDDILMKISHVIRGEDHRSNTALQAALFKAFNAQIPTFWHLPIICSADGKKLSKRDFGFSLDDLRKAGFLPQAICNYLGTTGASFKEEILTLQELARDFKFDAVHASAGIHYSLEKLTWVNHKWINKLYSVQLVDYVKPFLHEAIPVSKKATDEKISDLVSKVKDSLKTLNDITVVGAFYFNAPIFDRAALDAQVGAKEAQTVLELIRKHSSQIGKTEEFLNHIKNDAKDAGVGMKPVFQTLRYLITGAFEGMNLNELCELFDNSELKRRLSALNN